MKIIKRIISALLFSSIVYAEGEPLVVAVDNFAPPFVFRSGNNTFYGFDVDMMQHLCKIMNRTCQFTPLPFRQLIAAVENNDYSLAIGSITITPDRAQRVNFTIPYLTSQSRFIGRKDMANQPFTLALLANKTIGVESGTIFPQVIQSIGINNVTIKLFNSPELVIEALLNEDVDLAVLENATATYWSMQSSGVLQLVGKPYSYGFGFGIAVNKNNMLLLQELNNAIKQYQAGSNFKINYDRYFGQF